MDEVMSFFKNPNVKSQIIKGPMTAGCRVTKNDTIYDLNRREEHRQSDLPSGIDYAEEVKQRELEVYLKNEQMREIFDTQGDGLNSLEQLTSLGSIMPSTDVNLTHEAMTAVYNKYKFIPNKNTEALPINRNKDHIINMITAFPVVIIEGPTGCGKTTQVPQWILQDAYEQTKPCKIVVTQPRRIAATSIAKRVAQERGWDVGGVVGYQVALESKTSSDTRISYVTTGVLLQKLVNAKNMNEYTHIILDEVHERGQEMDFLILVVKKLLYTVSPQVKVILMSATFSSKAFFNYFYIPSLGDQKKPACINIKAGPSNQKIFYINHLNKLSIPSMSGNPEITTEMHHLVVKLVNGFELMENQANSNTDMTKNEHVPSVLIFLPGIHEIEELYMCLTNDQLRKKLCGDSGLHWWVLPLHSTITADEQVRVFQRAPPGQRKIILSTNIAESSITVPDIKYVIDYCLMKVLVADTNTNFTSLQLQWASKANCDQRAGRCGRVGGGGRVYRLVADKFYANFPDHCTPELRRCPLENLVLLAKTLDMGSPGDILALAMDPPDLSNVHRTILVLKEIGALTKLVDDEWTTSDGSLTYMGRIMALLPIDVHMSKLIILGAIFGCLDECVIMAAAMSVKNVFSSPFREQLNAYNSKLTWADGSTSDSIAFLNVYKVWNHLRQQQYFKQMGKNESEWAHRFYVQARAMRELDEMIRELRMRLSREEIDTHKCKIPWSKQDLPVVLKVILAGAFYPQYFVQVAGDEVREREAIRMLSGLDPRNSVYLKCFPDNQPGDIYASAIKKVIKKHIGDEPRVTFDKNSQKVYLTFNDNLQRVKSDKNRAGDPTIPGQVVLPVYKAIKARHLKMPIRIPLLPLDKANELAKAMEQMKQCCKQVDQMVPRLPEIDDTHFPLAISQFINVGNFWVQYADESTASELRQIQNKLNRKPLVPITDPPVLDMLVAAPYSDATGTKMYRARITRVMSNEMLELLYIDYGSVGRVNVCSLRLLPDDIDCPPLAMQCVLAEIAPAPLLTAHREWQPAALKVFTDLVSKGRLIGKVYSVTHGLVSIELLAEGGRISVNKELISKGLAVKCEERYDSKMNHDLRETACDLNMIQKRAYNKEQAKSAYDNVYEFGPGNFSDYVSDVHLKGPISPLETTVHSIMYGSHEKQVSIESSSVNSVLLDTEPQELYERLLVAADVGQNEMSSRLTLRHTTLMPNIPGLPAILALIFCPEAELRRDVAGSRYVSVLCGLGSSADGQPYFPEHDLLVNIDADLTVEDIGTINHLRYLMDLTMHLKSRKVVPADETDYTTNLPQIIREGLMKLLLKRRKHREPEAVQRAWEWKLIPEDELLSITIPDMVEHGEIYPLHAPIELMPMPRERLLELKRDNDELKLLVGRTSLTTNVDLSCKLCGTAVMPLHAMRIHLFSNTHREKEEELRI